MKVTSEKEAKFVKPELLAYQNMVLNRTGRDLAGITQESEFAPKEEVKEEKPVKKSKKSKKKSKK